MRIGRGYFWNESNHVPDPCSKPKEKLQHYQIMSTIIVRPRRNRYSMAIRELVRETHIRASDFVMPYFICEGTKHREAIVSLPGISRMSIDNVVADVAEAWRCGIRGIALFPAIAEHLKDKYATESTNPDGLLQRAIKEIKDSVPEMLIFSDVAMDPYSSDGHDGLVVDGEIVNDPTIDILCAMAISQAAAGSDFVAPSDMMDGRIGRIRQALDESGYQNCGIMAYSAKYASAYYGPFRDALNSAPKSGDKKTYQMDTANKREALREVLLDVEEGADIVMVKPATLYLDVIDMVKREVNIPVAAYNVSGEYAMVKAAAQLGWLDGNNAMMEMLLAIKRSGADIIFSYFALQAAKLID